MQLINIKIEEDTLSTSSLFFKLPYYKIELFIDNKTMFIVPYFIGLEILSLKIYIFLELLHNFDYSIAPIIIEQKYIKKHNKCAK